MVLYVLKLTAPKINGDDLSMLWTGGFGTSWLEEFIEAENLNGLSWKEPYRSPSPNPTDVGKGTFY